MPSVKTFSRPQILMVCNPAVTARDKAAVKAAGLDPETVLYSIRHTVISDWCAAGVPIDAVAKQAGTSTEMISTHYAKYLMGQKQAWFAAPSI